MHILNAFTCAHHYIIYSTILGDYRLEKRPIPDVEDGDVLVKVLAVGICARDGKCCAGMPYFWGRDTMHAYCFSNF